MHKHRYFYAAAVATLLAAVLIYVPGLRGPFVFDDASNILGIAGIRLNDLSFESLQEAWGARQSASLNARPLAMLSFALNYYFTEFDVFYFKLTNVAIHLAVGTALYVLTLMLLQRHQLTSPGSRYRVEHLRWLALAIAAVWLLHPLNLTSILYVVQRMTTLSALFTVLGLIGYCRGREQLIQGRKAGYATIIASLSLFGLLAMLCKENGALILPFAALIEAAFYRLDAHPSIVSGFRRRWLTALGLSLAVVAAVLIVQYEDWFGAHAYRFRDFTLEERLLTQTRVLWFYLRLVLIPDISLMGLYHDAFPVSRSLTEPVATLWAIAGIVALIGAAVAARTRLPVVFFTVGWFFVGHSLESTAFPLEMVHEHRNYLPQYGILFGIVYFLVASYRPLDRTAAWRVGFLALYVALLGIDTYARSAQWKDSYTLNTREVLNHPSSARAHTMLGVWLHEHGFPKDARRHFAIAAHLTPGHAETFIRLVHHVYATERRVPEAMMEQFRDRLLNGRISNVALWVYEPLLSISRDDTHWHGRFLDLYAMTVSRPDVEFNNDRYEAAYRLIADNYAVQGRDETALQYYERARAINARPYYDIAVARLYSDNGCYPKARELVSKLRVRHPALRPFEEEHLRDVEEVLATRGDRASGCAL